MNLIIAAELVNPPSESLAFRSVTMFAKMYIHYDNLIEVNQIDKDIYYKYMLFRGLLDFVEQLVTPEEGEKGVRIGIECEYPLTVKTDRINLNNYLNILGQIGFSGTR